MGRGPSRFRPSDVTRAIDAVKAAGERVARVEVDSFGKIVIVTGNGDSATTSSPNPWDEAVAKLAA